MKIKITTALIFLFSFHFVFSAVMSSSNYSIQSDSVNFGGGLSSSTNYVQESTFGEIATGRIESSNYQIRAGYQQMQEVYLAIGAVSDVSLSPSINSTGGGTANGSASVTVTTDSIPGYELYIKASSSPALNSGVNFFSDYTPALSDPDFTFSVPASTSEFGFSPEGSDVADEYKDDGTSCNTGASQTSNACWRGLSTTNELISRSTSGNHPSGTETVIKFRAESGVSNTQAVGTYIATTTVTAVAL
ncbi:MAG TPA: hypothetical protein VJC12_03445 [Candidatus Paceibacterota bacterium]